MSNIKGRISWFTPPLPKNQGYGIAAVETITALQEKGIRVDWNDTEPLVHINFIQPEFFEGHEFQYRIGYVPWESTEIPDVWVHYMNRMDEIWTTSNFCKEVYEHYKVNKTIRVVPHGINPEEFPIIDRVRADKFIFLHVGGPIERKGGSKVAEAFVEVFNDVDDAYLVMKSHGPSEARWYEKIANPDGSIRPMYRGNIKNHPRVEVIEYEMSTEQIGQLYGAAHCFVGPTSGEGFGMPHFQALATGIPSIITNLTGTADFAELSMPLKAKFVPCPAGSVHLGEWAEIDMDNLKALMWHAYSDWENEKKRAMQAARVIHGTQTWGHIADQIIEILGDKIDKSVTEDPIAGDMSKAGGYSDWVLQSFGAKADILESDRELEPSNGAKFSTDPKAEVFYD